MILWLTVCEFCFSSVFHLMLTMKVSMAALLTLLVVVTTTQGWNTCYTTNNEECVFPFTYQGKTHYKCTYDSSDNGRAWCATKTDRYGNAIRKR